MTRFSTDQLQFAASKKAYRGRTGPDVLEVVSPILVG